MELPQVSPTERPPAWLLEFGPEPYQRMWDLQRGLAHARQKDDIPDALMLLEHEPVITLGRRGKESHILATPEVLQEAGISLYRVERGGDVTYHGPGQLVGYPILRLAGYGLGVADYVHLLEEIIIRTLSDLGLVGTRRDKTIGVWLGDNKVAAFGARIERGVTYHGFALNVNPIMEHYDFIIPCGITDGGVTAIQHEVTYPVNVSRTRERVRYWFSEIFRVGLEPIPPERLSTFMGYELAEHSSKFVSQTSAALWRTARDNREGDLMTDQKSIAYCLKCKAKREMQNPEPVFSETGRPGTMGTCPVCGGKVYRPGRTPAHASLPEPEVKKITRKRRKRSKRNTKLVIVESPAKARTVGRFLGKGYSVKASIGHVRDLLRSRMSVDVDDNFKPTYRVPKKKMDVVKALRQEVKLASEVFLATDPDREGEAIAWHLMEAARIPEDITKRVVFHEITKKAIEKAFAHPRAMNVDLINAQQARRILDRLVGYSISPLLWRNVRSRLSAGRVQSVALRLIVDREREIQVFVPVEYWSIEAELARQAERSKKKRKSFVAKLARINGQEADLKNNEDTQRIVDDLEGATYIVESVKKRERRRRPSAPFTTSTMQQQSSHQLGFTARRTMASAQGLYEGTEIGDEGPVGLITYMRTDSVNVAQVAQQEARAFIKDTYGPEYLPPAPPKYKTRAKSAQEAHEAIRPTSVLRTPQIVRPYLPRDQYRLYKLIWSRFVASQMAPAIMDTTSVGIKAGRLEQPEALKDESQQRAIIQGMPYLFRVSASVIKFPGFLKVYDDISGNSRKEKAKEQRIPPLDEKDLLDLLELLPEQHFTQPPPRYSDATLIRTLEEFGIGRPSTYAPIVSTILNRGYVERVERRLHPTELAFIVNDLVVEHFPEIVDTGFTAKMETDLDRIAAGEVDWVKVLRDFYGPFHETLLRAEKNMETVDLPPEETGELCEKCGSPMIVKWGRYGKFIACSNFPDCRNTKAYMVQVGVKCPECEDGELVERRTKRGRTFFACNKYPECEFAVWNRPLLQPCPECGGLLAQAGKVKAKCTKCETLFDLEEIEKLQEESQKVNPQESS